VNPAHLLAEHGSPLWLCDVDRARRNLRALRAEWERAWPRIDVAYSYKTNRFPPFLRALQTDGAWAEVTNRAEYALARDAVGAAGERIVLTGPSKPWDLLARAADDGALVVIDSPDELERAAAGGVRRAGLRVAMAGEDETVSRLGVPAGEVVALARRARALGLRVEALAVHLVSTGFSESPSIARPLGAQVRVMWPQPAGAHARAAGLLARLARELAAEDVPVGTLDLGGGHPPAGATEHGATPVAAALRRHGFDGRLLVEPGRALVHDAVDLAMTVMAAKRLEDGRECLVVDAGTDQLPGTLWSWPRLEAPGASAGPGRPTLVTGPLCLNVDVLHPAARLPPLGPGDTLLARGVGAYQDAQSSRFGDLRPAALAREDGAWRLARRRESVDDLMACDITPSPKEQR
jgi:diaminopimelate decarboxylase